MLGANLGRLSLQLQRIIPDSSKNALTQLSKHLEKSKLFSSITLENHSHTGITTRTLTNDCYRTLHTLKSHTLDEAKARYKELLRLLPDTTHPEYAIRKHWINHLISHKFTVTPDFVAQLGQSVHLIDVREEHELTGPVGYIPGVNWYPKSHIDKIIQSFPDDSLIAIVCMNDTDSREVVRQLQAAGKKFAAIVAGGMRSWKLMGFSTSRDPEILSRCSVRISSGSSDRVPCPVNKDGKKQLPLKMVADHIADGRQIQWLKMAAFMVHGRLSCVDGRDDCGVIGTPGGDLGEFAIALSVAEELLNRQLSEADIESLFERRLDSFGRFYMHSDQTCVDSLMSLIYADPYLKEYIKPSDDPLATNIILHTIPQNCREKVVELLLQTDNIGCGHIKLLITKAEQYKIRPELVKCAIKCFFYALWDGSTECDFVILSGLHEECGVASVSIEGDVHSFTRIPLLPPTIQGNQMFVAHGQIATYLRQQQAEWIIAQNDILPFTKLQATAYPAMLNLLADLHTSLTLSNLATDLPLYSLRFTDTGYCDVTYQGLINSKEGDAKSEEAKNRLVIHLNEHGDIVSHDSQDSKNQIHTTTAIPSPPIPAVTTQDDKQDMKPRYTYNDIRHGKFYLDQGLEHISTRRQNPEESQLKRRPGDYYTVHIDIPHHQHHFGVSHSYPTPSLHHNKLAEKITKISTKHKDTPTKTTNQHDK